MPKKKTHKGARNRLRVTRNGKVVRYQAGKRKLSRPVLQGGKQGAMIRYMLSA